MRNACLLIVALICFLYSCSKDDSEEINHPPVAAISYFDNIRSIRLVSNSTDEDNDELNYTWIVRSDLVSVSDVHGTTAQFYIPELSEPLEIKIELIVSDGKDSDTASESIVLPVLTDIRRWGLGEELKEEVSNNVEYEWYMDQMNTGVSEAVNCGPTAVTMSIKWFNPFFGLTPQDARNKYWMSGGWWYTNNIIDYLNFYSVINKTIALDNTDNLIDELKQGNIIILCLDMFYIPSEADSELHVDKFYETESDEWGHFIVVKGYKKVDITTYFEAYDPFNWGHTYYDNKPKGKDRYYNAADIDEATNKWWDYAIVVSREAFKSADGIDVSKIQHKKGG